MNTTLSVVPASSPTWTILNQEWLPNQLCYHTSYLLVMTFLWCKDAQPITLTVFVAVLRRGVWRDGITLVQLKISLEYCCVEQDRTLGNVKWATQNILEKSQNSRIWRFCVSKEKQFVRWINHNAYSNQTVVLVNHVNGHCMLCINVSVFRLLDSWSSWIVWLTLFLSLFQSPDCNDRVQVQRLLLNCPDIGKHRDLYMKTSIL